MTSKFSHQEYMQLALSLAERGKLTVSPNPMVGCVIVKDNQIIGQGFHQKAGEPHAEIYALQEAGSNAENATVYVTLEPCCHQGRTGPCVDALIKSGIKKVFVACEDPNPLVAGKGLEALEAAGIEVETGLENEVAKKLNKIFFHFIQTRKPYVIAKWAMSLDGKTKTHPHDSPAISNSTSRQTTHLIRSQVDAILIGANTAIEDDPLLTVRLPEQKNIKQPLRIILANRKLPLTLKMLDNSTPGKTLIVSTEHYSDWLTNLNNPNVEILVTQKNEAGLIDLPTLLTELGARNITSLLVEGGMQIHHSFFSANLVNQIQVYLAPVIIGDLPTKQRIQNMYFSQIESDYFFNAEVGAAHV